jgi:hypothetical protein
MAAAGNGDDACSSALHSDGPRFVGFVDVYDMCALERIADKLFLH